MNGYLGSVLSTLLFWQMVQNHDAVSWALKIAGGISFYIVYYAITHLDGKSTSSIDSLTICVFDCLHIV
jgi:POT family proton-dependent oligopeptide transporter